MRPEARPAFGVGDAERIFAELYGLHGVATALPSDRDQNYKLTLPSQKAYVLKFFHADEGPELVEAQRQVFEQLAALPRRVFPRLVATRHGASYSRVGGPSGLQHLTWLTPFMPGQAVAGVRAPSDALLNDVGAVLAAMDQVLALNPQTAARRSFAWAAQSAPETIAANLEHVAPSRRELLEDVLRSFDSHVRPRLPELRLSLIHNDVNDHNLLVVGDEVSAILDFGDMLESYLVCEVAHAACYLMLDETDALRVAREVVRGYQAVHPLNPAELGAIYDLIRLRLALSVTQSAYRRRLEPDDPYLSISEGPAYRLLQRLAGGAPSREEVVRTITSL